MDEPDSERKARLVLEKARWPEAVSCPTCGTTFKPKRDTGFRLFAEKREARICERVRQNGRHQYRCCLKACQRDAFTVSTDTFMDHTHLPYKTWLQAMDLVWGGADSSQLKRRLNMPYETAAKAVDMIQFARDNEDLKKTSEGNWLIRADPTRYSRAAKKARKLEDADNWTENDLKRGFAQIDEEFGPF